MKKFIVLIILFSSCNTNLKYINDSVDIMQQNSVKKDSVDWAQMRENSRKEINNNNSKENAYKIIRSNLWHLNDNHSFLLTPEDQKTISNENNDLPHVRSKKIDGNIGYLKIPPFFGTNKQAEGLAEIIQNKIKEIDSKETEKWIIDLTDNLGGNMWPMFLGLAPILKTGVTGYFVDANENYIEWKLKDNAVFAGEDKLLQIDHSYLIKSDSPKVAILINSRTASSGEAIALMFKSFEKTKFFGEDSYGLTTGNQSFKLSDGAQIFLTTTVFADRTKRKYGKLVVPDVYTSQPKEKAIKWLNKE